MTPKNCSQRDVCVSLFLLSHNHLLFIRMWHEGEKGSAKQLSPKQECSLRLTGFNKINIYKYINVLIMRPVSPSGKYRM